MDPIGYLNPLDRLGLSGGWVPPRGIDRCALRHRRLIGKLRLGKGELGIELLVELIGREVALREVRVLVAPLGSGSALVPFKCLLGSKEGGPGGCTLAPQLRKRSPVLVHVLVLVASVCGRIAIFWVGLTEVV